jgi:hypothetical protein
MNDMKHSKHNKVLADVGKALAEDLHLERSGRPTDEIQGLAARIMSINKEQRLVYTAFDGDHFHLCGLMRSFVMEKGHVPANPENILGYVETVSHRLTKQGVLMDDLAVLRTCDELWVFTDYQPDLSALSNLAEGVLVELLYFLKRKVDAQVYFVSPIALLEGRGVALCRFPYSYAQSKDALHPDLRDGVLELANSGSLVDEALPQVVYHIHDPLDFKYARWLRQCGYRRDKAPLVPGLAIEIDDRWEKAASLVSLGKTLVAWAKLMEIASCAYLLPPFTQSRAPSVVSEVLRSIWCERNAANTLSTKRWTEYPIPKARQGARWPLTKKEANLIKGFWSFLRN